MSKLDEILRSRGVLPATPATPATRLAETPPKVARVATVARSNPTDAIPQGPNKLPAGPIGSGRSAVHCLDCRYFQARAGQTPDGQCRLYTVETWSAVALQCRGYSPGPAVQAMEERRRKVEAQLRADPKLRIAADVADAPLKPEPGLPVSIAVAVRTDVGIVSGELRAPRDRFDSALFFTYLGQLSENPS